MATSSITKNFVISGKEQVEMFVNAIEESAKNRPVRTPVNVKFIETEDEVEKLRKAVAKELGINLPKKQEKKSKSKKGKK